MSYRVQVSGKIFEGDDLRTLLKRAVEARQHAGHRPVDSGGPLFTPTPIPSQIDRGGCGKQWKTGWPPLKNSEQSS